MKPWIHTKNIVVEILVGSNKRSDKGKQLTNVPLNDIKNIVV